MDASTSHQSDVNPTLTGASKFLQNLPSRGYFSSTVVSSNPGKLRVYISERDTSLPEDQEIKTNQQNILIRALTLRNNTSKDTKGAMASESSRKRTAERVADSRAKRANAQTNSEEGSASEPSRNLQSLTVERLRALLKEKGLSPKGKKDELIARLRSTSGKD